ncbi:solute carrier family 22 member 3-like isoform X1 [Zophobas morio]|uniref:solute carrier family 22 member 3-like isoform X1 n=1 Tax=Zophobas morio TaxID=2755281 RepID=UPI003083B690
MSGMKFYRPGVEVSSTSPPEELLTSLAGSCGRWQIAVVVFCMVSNFLNGLDIAAVSGAVPLHPHFICADGNGSQCVNANGTTCKNFTFFNEDTNLITFTEKLSLVCDRWVYATWIKNCYRLGLVIGSLLTGSCADRFGMKVTLGVFMSLHCFTGLLVISITNQEILMFFIFFNGVFSVTIFSLPLIIVCDTVGNKWRTLALGTVFLHRSMGIIIFQFIQNVFGSVEGALAGVSVLPLIVLIPLLYYKESPNYMAIKAEYSKGEKTLGEIAHFNRNPISASIKVRPVRTLIIVHISRVVKCYVRPPFSTFGNP